MQEALLAIHTKRETYDPNEPFTAWIHAIARYKLIDHLRRRHVEESGIPAEDIETVMSETDDHAGVESALDLATLMADLPEKMRRAIECVKIEGLSVEEAARQCGMSESAVKVSVHRGLKALSLLVARRSGP